jgi:hypothetical protein
MADLLWLSFDEWSARMYEARTVAYCELLESRILPIFDDIEGEKQRVATAVLTWPGWGEDDSESAFEAAHESGTDAALQFMELRSVYAATGVSGLFHLFEKQLYEHLNRELEGHLDRPINTWVNVRNLFEAFNKKNGTPSTELLDTLEAPDLRELRLVANAIKHGPGRSLQELVYINAPVVDSARLEEDFTVGPYSILGVSISIHPEDIERYRNAALGFWSLRGDFSAPLSTGS